MQERIVQLIEFNKHCYPDKIVRLLDNVFAKLSELNILYSKNTTRSISSLYDCLSAGDYDKAYKILSNLFNSYYKIRGQGRIGTVIAEFEVGNYLLFVQQDIGTGAPVAVEIYELR